LVTTLSVVTLVGTASRARSVTTRTLKTPLVVVSPLVDVVRAASETAAALVSQLPDRGEQALRGRAGAVRVWTRKRSGLPAAAA
jgi:hypothetical protein